MYSVCLNICSVVCEHLCARKVLLKSRDPDLAAGETNDFQIVQFFSQVSWMKRTRKHEEDNNTVRFYACGKMYKTNSQELRIVGPKQLMIEAMNIQALLTLDFFCCIRYLNKQCANISAKLKAAVVLRWKQEIRRRWLSSFGGLCALSCPQRARIFSGG